MAFGPSQRAMRIFGQDGTGPQTDIFNNEILLPITSDRTIFML